MMQNIQLKYGNSTIPFEYDEDQFQVFGKLTQDAALTDIEIGEAFDNPIDSKTLEEIVQPNETVLFVVPDATRSIASGQIINLLVRRLIANGTMPHEIACIFAVGIHRPVTEDEKKEILTPFILQRIKNLEHNSRDLAQIVKFGNTKRGIPIELNRALTEYDHIILIGGINFHYFAGFTGGRKLICPGLGSTRTISETHKLAFDFEQKTRREGVGIGLLKGNAVHEEFLEVVQAVNPSFSVNTFVNGKGEATAVFAGNWKTSHQKACDVYAERQTIEIAEKRDIVIVSCGGFPHDINMIQAHKALEMASHACNDGGIILFLAECSDGLGRSDFLNWFEAENSKGLAEKLCESYQVNGQTAWSLLKKAERFNIKIVTNLSESETSKMRLEKVREIGQIDKSSSGYIFPFGAKFMVKKR
ncbi:MAG: nickel-dependent lactate racemase [Pyrinomonadaceae bacterium]|nr:nickel-dependent lactate racemase [Pyrinomonadaceae bacterium]